MIRNRPLCLGLCLLLGLLGVAPRVGANTRTALSQAKERYQRGAEHFRAGRYPEAREEFAASYLLSGRAALLYNLALTEDKLGNTQAAIGHLERYLAGRVVEDRAAAQDYLAVLRQRQALAPPPPPPPPLDRRARLRVAAWATGAAGLASVVAGGALLGVDGRPTCGDAPQQCKHLLDTRAGGAVALTGGLLLLGGAAALWIIERRKGPARAASRPTWAELLLAGSF